MTNLSSDFGHWIPMEKHGQDGLDRVNDAHIAHGLPPVEELWSNDVYEVFVTALAPGFKHLSIKRYDRRPIRNWRHFQQIKNEVCGEEAEGVELYPAESRLVDNANQYHLWVVETPAPPGAAFTLEGPGGEYDDFMVVPRDPELGGVLRLGMPKGGVTDDAAVESYNAARERGEHRGRQEPWQPGLTTGRGPETPYTDEEGQPRRPE